MNIICFSGFCIDLGTNHRQQLKKWFDEYFKKDYVVLAHVCGEKHKHELKQTFENAIVQVEPNVPIDTSGFYSKEFRTGLPTYLQQIHAYRKVNSLRKTLLQENDFDRIVRCRYDLKFYSSPNEIETIEDDEIGIPDFHHWKGYNDRMAIMGGKVANYYMDILTFLLNDKEKCIHPEKNLKFVLEHFNVKVKMLNIKFNRVRSISKEMNDCENERTKIYNILCNLKNL